jgi:hypothetical protein
MTISASRIVGGQGLEFRSSIHGGWHEAIGVALFGDIPDAGDGEVIAEVIANERELILRRHIENPLSRLGGRPGIGVKAEYPVGMAEGNRRVCDEVPRKEEILARRRQEISRLPRSVAAARYDADAFDALFAVFDENHAADRAVPQLR